MLRYVIALSALLFTACESQHAKLERGVSYAKHRFEAVNTSPLAAISFQSTSDLGGNLTTFLTASLPENSDLPPFREGPPKPWNVMIKSGEDDATIVIEGYGDDLSKPLIHEEVTIDPQKAVDSLN